MQEIQWFRKVMFELQEEERERIAADLHDTTMQDLFFLKKRFITLMEKYAMNEQDEEQLNSMIQFIEMINVGLRQSCFELHPYLLKEVGLVETLKIFLEKEAVMSPFELIFIAESASAIERRDLPTKRHLFRVVQELLNNAKKHSQASRVTFRIAENHQHFYLIYEDDGIGFVSKDDRVFGIGTSGLGMEQIRSRILYVGGKIEMSSQIGKGTAFTITIPVTGALTA